MILFYGEMAFGDASRQALPDSHPIGTTRWEEISSTNTTIRFCDFSPENNRTRLNERYTAAISGDPVIIKGDQSNQSALATISEELLQGRVDSIRSANGVFCGFYLDNRHGELTIFTDYLGLRKIFISRQHNRIQFANTQWLIEKLLPSNSEFDEQSIVEMGTMGYALENRTRRRSIEILEPGTILTIDRHGKSTKNKYYSLTETRPITISEDAALDALQAAWNTAVADRLQEESPLAFLSGGMDSRLLVHTLKALGSRPFGANFAPTNTMDRVFAVNAANVMDVPLWLHPTGSLNTDLLLETVNDWTATISEISKQNMTRYIWSGDGGSVGMGHVYLDDEIIRLCEQTFFHESARRFCVINKRKPVARAYSKNNVKSQLEETIGKIFSNFGETQPSRAPYYFLMLNDQRRHLDHHYENIHIRKFDFKLPFFDRRLVELISSLPSMQFNMHRKYDRLFRKIGGSLIATAWQTYPNHVPCNIPAPRGSIYQWDNEFHSKVEIRRQSRSNAAKTLAFAFGVGNGQHFFNRSYIATASLATIVGLVDRSYLYQCVRPVM